MAKGDQSNSAQQPPKTDQYSVMHKIMDAFGSPNTSIAPSQMPQMGSSQQSILPGDQVQPLQPNNGGFMGGRFHAPGIPMGSNWGITGGAGSIAPSNPQDMMRRTMVGKGTFGQ